MRFTAFVKFLTPKRLCFTKMNGSRREVPIGIQCVQKLYTAFCPRLQINRLRWYQASVLILTYITYTTYHLTRKPISVVKSVLHRNCSGLTPPPGTPPGDEYWCDWPPFNTHEANALLGALDSAFLFSYAAAMFVSGLIAERVDLRYFLSMGMLASAVFCYLFGLGYTLPVHSISFYLLVQAGAGIAQTTGWPGTVAVVGKWFPGKKGLIFGIWNSHTSLGNILGTLMAAAYVEREWSLSFMFPALVMGVAAFLVFLLLVPDPKCVHLAINEPPSRQSRKSDDEEGSSQVLVGDLAASLRPSRHSANASPPPQHPEEISETTALISRRSSTSSEEAVSLYRALSIPGVVEFSLSLFFAKLVSYTFLYWLPVYIATSTSLTPKQSGELSTVFDVGGAAGAVLVGFLADCTACPATVCVGFYLLCAPALFVYQWYGAASYGVNAALLVLSGALVNGPYALITTAVSADLGTHSSLAGNSLALATVTAIIDGTGSVGAALGPMLAGVVSSTGSWAHVFYMLIACNVLGMILLLRISRNEVLKIRQDRRLASPRVVRIE